MQFWFNDPRGWSSPRDGSGTNVNLTVAAVRSHWHWLHTLAAALQDEYLFIYTIIYFQDSLLTLLYCRFFDWVLGSWRVNSYNTDSFFLIATDILWTIADTSLCIHSPACTCFATSIIKCGYFGYKAALSHSRSAMFNININCSWESLPAAVHRSTNVQLIG